MKLTEFVLSGCPYCRQAGEVLDELRREKEAYGAIELEIIDESENPALADRYDYYRVPSFFKGTEKLYEADPRWSRGEVKRRLAEMLDGVLES